MQNKQVVIASRFNGPPNSANGGYTAGLLARELNMGNGRAVNVALRYPPPLDKPLALQFDDSSADLFDGEQVIANAKIAEMNFDIPACPPHDEIKPLLDNYVDADEHAYSTCFVCGPARAPDDGLNIFPVVLDKHNCVISLWTPGENLLAKDGLIATEIVWAALDCPGYFAHRTDKMMLLGSMKASVMRRPSANECLTSMGWQRTVDGRKYFSGTALYDINAKLCAVSEQIWIALK